MLEKIRIQRYKSLYDVTLELAPLTALIGPNGSGKSNVCEVIYLLSKVVEKYTQRFSGVKGTVSLDSGFLEQFSQQSLNTPHFQNMLWHGEDTQLQFDVTIFNKTDGRFTKEITFPSSFELPIETAFAKDLENAKIYDFYPASLAQSVGPTTSMNRSGQGITYALADILLNHRQKFDELEARFTALIPNVSRIILERQPQNNQFSLFLQDRFSDYRIPATNISDGTLRILAFLTALYEINTPRLLCFEEPENGIHPWLLNKVVELLNLVSTEGVYGQPVQILLTTHSPTFLNLLQPEQVRAVELNGEGKTLVHKLPTNQKRFQKAMEAYDGALGELWFTNMFGGNPE
jgi:predicted ATPase